MEIILEAGRADRHYWRDLWRYRELFQVLARRDIAVRYKQTVLGVAWAVVRPLATMAVFTVVFGTIAGLPTEGAVPYALLVAVGMLPWTFFSAALADASNSLISNANLIGKVFFPRMIIPAASIVVAMIDLLVNFVLVLILMVWFRFVPGKEILLLPVLVLVAFLAVLGPSLWMTALNVKYRDVRYIVPFVVQFGLYVSPVGFSSSVVPEQWRLVYALNPMVGVIDGFRWSLLGGTTPVYWPGAGLSLVTIAVFLFLGFRRFRKTERAFADFI